MGMEFSSPEYRHHLPNDVSRLAADSPDHEARIDLVHRRFLNGSDAVEDTQSIEMLRQASLETEPTAESVFTDDVAKRLCLEVMIPAEESSDATAVGRFVKVPVIVNTEHRAECEVPELSADRLSKEGVPQFRALLHQADGSYEARMQAADTFWRSWPVMLRERILEGPIGTLDARTPGEQARLLGQLEFLADATEQRIEVDELAAVGVESVRAYLEAGGDRERLAHMFDEAEKLERGGELLADVRRELAKEFAVEAVKEAVSEAAGQTLAILLAVPAGPAGAILAAAHLARILDD